MWQGKALSSNQFARRALSWTNTCPLTSKHMQTSAGKIKWNSGNENLATSSCSSWMMNIFLRIIKQAHHWTHLPSYNMNPCLICSNSTYIKQIEHIHFHTSNLNLTYLAQFFMKISDSKLNLLSDS